MQPLKISNTSLVHYVFDCATLNRFELHIHLNLPILNITYMIKFIGINAKCLGIVLYASYQDGFKMVSCYIRSLCT